MAGAKEGMRKILLFFMFYLVACPCLSHGIEVYFSPNGGCQQAVISEIRKAARTIDIAMYYLSSRDIAHALVKAQENNVRVRIVLDQGQEIEAASKSGYLIKHGFQVRYHLGFGLMHNKFAIIDGKSLITGSFNWTLTAEERNEENLLIVTDEGTIEKFKQRFDYLWYTSRPDSRNAKGLEVLPSWFCATLHIFCTN
jgi:phosphatidylserine/phosphatidylglycerophosphate/cardiolipin synthase-like enzyme